MALECSALPLVAVISQRCSSKINPLARPEHPGAPTLFERMFRYNAVDAVAALVEARVLDPLACLPGQQVTTFIA